MTTYLRDEFWRTSKYGVPHRVGAHSVERHDWARAGSGADQRSAGLYWLAQMCADQGVTSRFVFPNAECPVCGASVFFYQNGYGSRVYFDELGPPWPKHPCTASDDRAGPAYSGDSPIEPSVRKSGEMAYIEDLQNRIGMERDHEFWERYGSSPWSAFRLDGRFRTKTGTLFALSPLSSKSEKRVFLAAMRPPRSLHVGQLVFEFRNWLTYLDPTDLQPVEIEVEKIPSSNAFLDRLLDSVP